MKSTFKVLFYLKKDKISKDGKVPVMGRITVNGTQAGFSCKLNIDPALWDEKTNYLKSQRNTLSREIHQMLENIKAQIAKHYQSISDRDAYVTANKVKNAYHGFGDRYKTLIAAFDYHADSIKARIGRDRTPLPDAVSGSEKTGRCDFEGVGCHVHRKILRMDALRRTLRQDNGFQTHPDVEVCFICSR